MTAGRTIAVDLRAAQFNGDRGIPAYAQSLALELVRGHASHRWLLLHDPVRPLPARAAELATHAEWRCVADLDRPGAAAIDVLLTGCFFLPHHGCGADYLLPPAIRRGRPRRLGIVYDLVPLVFPDRYLARERARRQYRDCLRVLRSSDELFAISRATRHDTIRHAAVDPARVRCIYGDIDHAKRAAMARPAAATADVPARHGLAGPYGVCVGGDDWRKNMEAAVRAFAIFHRDHPAHRLAIVCKLSAERIAGLLGLAAEAGLPAGAVTCTGYVSDDDLVALVRHAAFMIYPSLYEGLGLPVLEAYGCGTPVVGSDTSSVAELVPPELACDPRNPAAFAAALGRLVTSPATRAASLTFGRRLLAEELGWDRAAAAVMETVEAGTHRTVRPVPRRPDVAVVAALPPARTGIAPYTLAHLQSDRWLTTFYDANPGPRVAVADGLAATSRILPAELFPAAAARGRHDVAVFVLGNSPHHAKVLEALVRSRGSGGRRLAYLHEAALESLVAAWLGEEAERLPAPPPAGRAGDWIAGATAAKPALGRCLRLLAERGELDGLVVNSHACRDLVHAVLGDLADRWTIDVAFLPLPAGGTPTAPRRRPTAGPLRVGSFGLAGDTKRLDLVARAVAILGRRRPVRLVLAGWDARRYCRRTGLVAGDVEVIDSPADEELLEAMRGVDVAVQLRWPTFGESSGVVNQLLAAGTPLVVTAAGSFAELPAEVATAVPADCPPAELARAIEAAALRTIDDAAWRDLAATRSAAAFSERMAGILAGPAPAGGQPAAA